MNKKILDRLPIFNDPYVRRLLGYLPAYKKEIALAVTCMILGAASSSLIALLLGKLTDLGFYEHNPSIVWWTPVGLIGISILHAAGEPTGSCSYSPPHVWPTHSMVFSNLPTLYVR